MPIRPTRMIFCTYELGSDSEEDPADLSEKMHNIKKLLKEAGFTIASTITTRIDKSSRADAYHKMTGRQKTGRYHTCRTVRTSAELTKHGRDRTRCSTVLVSHLAIVVVLYIDHSYRCKILLLASSWTATKRYH